MRTGPVQAPVSAPQPGTGKRALTLQKEGEWESVDPQTWGPGRGTAAPDAGALCLVSGRHVGFISAA